MLIYIGYKEHIYSGNFSIKYDNISKESFCDSQFNYSWFLQRNNNKGMKTINGNRANDNKIKIMQYNKGSSNFSNHIHHLQNIINLHDPHIICISEANIKAKDNVNMFDQLLGYNIETNMQYDAIGVSRNCIMVKNGIKYKRRQQFEDKLNSDIWIEISNGGRKNFLLCGSYRQWSLLKEMGIKNSGTIQQQEDRYKKSIENWQKALDENRDTIFLTDDNIDSNINSDLNKKYRTQNLQSILYDHMIKNNLLQHNHENTRFVRHHKESCIDHIYSNVPNKISDVKTHRNSFSDHSFISAVYHSQEQCYNPKFIKTRNFRNLNKTSLHLTLDQSEIDRVFNFTDPNVISNILQTELNTVINTLAPAKVVQYKVNYTPFLTDRMKRDMEFNKNLLDRAIKTHGIDDWREYRVHRNILNKQLKILKKKYIKQKFKDSHNRYKFLKKHNKNLKQQVPSSIVYNKSKVTSPKTLASIAVNYFCEKVNLIKASFVPTVTDPLKILSKLVPRVQNDLIIPYITVKDTQKLISSLKNSNCTGYDDISFKILKKINHRVAPHICHLINSILFTKIFPDIFKLSRILPISKNGLPIDTISSFRPINNLCSLEKVIETYFMQFINKHLSDNNILNEFHQGGPKNHSTITAMTLIYNKLLYNKENSIISTILCTDISGAFDTVDKTILLNKMEYYGFRGPTLEIFTSYFTDRLQYVCIDTFNSEIVNAPEGGCIQGSKISGTCYNLYVNEVPYIYKLLYDPLFKEITGHDTLFKYKNFEHLTINYIDDSNSIISNKDHSHIKHYIEDYYKLIHGFYNINKLKLNPDKNKILIIYNKKFEYIFKNFSFKAENYIIKRSNVIKILGTYVQSDLKLDREISKLSSNLHNRINNLRQIKEYTDFKTRLSFLNSFVIGKMKYMIPLYMNAPAYEIKKLHKVLMTSARLAIGSYCFKKSCDYMLKKCNWLNINNLINHAGISLTHKIINKKEPISILKLYKSGKNKRIATRWYTMYNPKTENMKKFYIYKSLDDFYKIPKEIQSCKPNLFKKKLKIFLETHTGLFDSMD